MRKLCAAILSAAICLSVSGAPAWASEHQSTLSAGYLHARTNAPGSDNLNGINVKYRYEFTDALGLACSLTRPNPWPLTLLMKVPAVVTGALTVSSWVSVINSD